MAAPPRRRRADQSYNWYVAARSLRRNPAAWRDAAALRGEDAFEADRAELTLHLFAAAEGGWGGGGHVVELAACALLVFERDGHGAARLQQLCAPPEGSCGGRAASGEQEEEDPFHWELRLVDAADLLAEQRGHLWLAVSAPEGSEWRAALEARGFRKQAVPPGETDNQWLIKGTPLRARV